MRTSNVSSVLSTLIANNKPCLLVGAPGVGKTSLVQQACDKVGYELIVSHPATADPTDVKGLPHFTPDGGAEWVPFGELQRVLQSTKPTVWFWDDLGQASPTVQATMMPWLLARRIGNMVLPDCVVIVAATNGREHKAAVTGIIAPQKSRFTTILPVEPNVEDWSTWAIENELDPFVIAWVRNCPQFLLADKVADGLENEPNPRTLKNLSDLVKLGLPADCQVEAFSGAVGRGAAMEFCTWRAITSNMVSIEQIIRDPQNAALPEGLSQLYSTAVAMGMRAKVETFDAFAIYLERLHKAGHSEFAVLVCKDASRKCPDITATPAWTALMGGPVGAMFRGESQ